MNSEDVGRVAAATGYAWPTERGPYTTPRRQRLDHVFLKGLAPPNGAAAPAAAGVVSEIRGASDHFAVWAIAVLR
jgi:endonuclease/exonuclease/phosphatase family metal-dependent hydrolase